MATQTDLENMLSKKIIRRDKEEMHNAKQNKPVSGKLHTVQFQLCDIWEKPQTISIVKNEQFPRVWGKGGVSEKGKPRGRLGW